jgi:uncharacterized glyoxalase superfamily protein PhnB
LLGLDVASGAQFGPADAGRHTVVTVTGARMDLEFDNPGSLRLFAADAANVRTPILGFAYATPEAVDTIFERLSAAGHAVRQPPHDAFWGARYAIVEDPNGNAVGLMGPIDRSRGYAPGADADETPRQ